MKDHPLLNIKKLNFQWDTADPFLFCVHHEDHYPEGNEKFGPDTSLEGRNLGRDFELKNGFRMYHGEPVPGFPVHPHRGFETVTIVRQGFVDHSDSMGAAGRYGMGDVQWLTAGSGVQHAEMFPLLNRNSRNTLELFQIWLNLPRSRKFAKPEYKMFWKGSTPVWRNENENGKQVEVNIIAGSFNGLTAPAPPSASWAADPSNEVNIWSVRMESGTSWVIPAAAHGLNRTLYFFKGSGLKINGTPIAPYHAATLNPEVEALIENEGDLADCLLLQAKPIVEPVEQYGPFVMNSMEEIQQAYDDYRKTRFGGWPWPEDGPVHGPEKVRFARFMDGSIEKPNE